MLPPPPPEVASLPLAAIAFPSASNAVNVKTSVLDIASILYSLFKISAVMAPPKVAAPLNVTQFPAAVPCPASVTVIVEDPFDAPKVACPAPEAALAGVILNEVPPALSITFSFVPPARYLTPCKPEKENKLRHIPLNLDVVYFVHPPIFLGNPLKNRTLLHSYHPPSWA